MRKIIVLLIFLLIPKILQSQYYMKGQDPSSVRWKEINSKHFRVLFPESYSEEGQRLTNILEYSLPQVSDRLSHTPSKIPVIVHNLSTHSNGFVSWAPKRIELYPVPDPVSHPQESLEQLALHELHHLVQVDKLNQGTTRLFSYIFGEQITGAVTGMLPLWYLEGDAVHSETFLSRSGRGKMPSFEMKLKAVSLEKEKYYSYDKMLLESFKDYTPDYYQYGYQIVKYSRQKFGDSLWNNSIDYTGKNPFLLNPLNFSLHKQTGLTKRKLYEKTFDHLQNKWEKENSNLVFKEFDTINSPDRRAYESYRFPQYINDTLIVTEKSGIDQIREFITINAKTGNERVLHKPGFYQSVRLSAGDNKIVWAENIPDARWGNRSYSDIKIFDITSSTETRLTHKKRYFSPAISDNGEKIVAVDINEKNEASLIILDANYGNTIQKINMAEGLTPMMPEWSENDDKILFVSLTNAGKSICEIDTETGKIKTYVAPGFYDIKNVVPLDNYILFHNSYSGTDNIYAVNRSSSEIFRITSSRFGAFDIAVSPDRSEIAFSDYSSEGYNIGTMTFDPDVLINPVSFNKKREQGKPEQNKFVFDHDSVPANEYDIKPYKRGLHLFNFHSWMPFYFEPDNFELTDPSVSPGLTLLGQNDLSTSQTILGYEYSDNNHLLHSKFIYKGWYPVIELSADYGGTPVIFRDSTGIALPDNYSNRINFRSKIHLPLNLTQNRFSKLFDPSLQAVYTNSFLYNNETREYDRGRLLLNYRLYYSTLLKLSHRDFQPRWGQVFDINFLHTPFDNFNYGNDFSFRSILYFPGFLRHDGLKFKFGREKQNPEKFLFYNTVSFPRGYDHRNIISEELTSVSAEYSVPLLYPDLNLLALAYLKRFRGNFFVDYSTGKRNHDLLNGTYNKYRQNYLSVGGSITGDINFLRIPFPVSLGLEYAYMPYRDSYDIRFLFEMNIYGFAINRDQY